MNIEAMKQVKMFLENLTTHRWTLADQQHAIDLQSQVIADLERQEPKFITHSVEEPYDWSKWVCPDPNSYLMKCCDCGLVHEAQFGVVRYADSMEKENCEMVDDSNLQAVFRMRRSEEWSPTDMAYRPEGLSQSEAEKQEPVGINGLTEAETNATASVMGLVNKQEPVAKICHDLEQHIGWNPNAKVNEFPEGMALYTSPPYVPTERQRPATELRQPLTKWQPIETAPKDGSEILMTNGVDVSSGSWFAGSNGTYDYDGAPNGDDKEAGWMDWSGGMQPDPTHWMPLPSPIEAAHGIKEKHT